MANDLEFRIGAELSEIKGALASLQKDFQRTGQAAQQAGGNNAFKGLETSARAALRSVAGLVAGVASIAAAIKLIGAADEINTLNARLKLVTNSTEEYIRAQQALFDLSQRTRSGISETIDLYSKIAGATKEAGVGQETLLQVVETINQAVQLSGASTQAAQAALMQLGQGLASGTLRGEELNSILEQTPALADAIAKGMGITRGELRKYGEEGKISSQQVISALQAQREEVARNFATLPLTVGQGITLVKNAALQLVGAFDSASGATSGLAEILKQLAEYISSDEFIGSVIEFTAVWSNSFRQIVEDAQRAVQIMRDSTKDIVGSGEDIVDILGRAFRELPANVRASIKIVTVQAAAMFDYLVSYATFVKDNFKAIFTGDTQEAAFARFQSRNAAIKDAAQGVVDDALNERSKALNDAKQARADADARRKQGRQDTGANGQGQFKPAAAKDGEVAKAAALAKAKLDAEEKLLDDSAKRQLSTLEQLFEDSRIAAADYYARRQEIELASIDRSIALERQRAQAGGVEQVKALAEIELLERRKADIQTKAQVDANKFKKSLDKQLEDARIAQLENGQNAVEVARAKAEAKYSDLLARLTAEGDTAGLALINNLINSEVAEAKLQELKDKVSATVADLRSQEALISAQADAGLLPTLEAERQLQELRTTSIEQLKQYSDALKAVAAAQTANGGVADPRVVELIRQTDTEIARATASTQKLQNQIQQNAQGALTGLFTDLANGAMTFGDAIKRAALAFIQSLAQMAAEALAKKALLSLGGGSAGGGFAGFLASFFHSGGTVGQGGGTSRAVNPLVFAGAPRYHSGGMVGLKPDERPAILQTGEEVLSRKDPRNQANGGAQGGSGYRIVNVLDPGLVSNFMESSAGEKTIMNIIGRNPSQVRQLIGT